VSYNTGTSINPVLGAISEAKKLQLEIESNQYAAIRLPHVTGGTRTKKYASQLMFCPKSLVDLEKSGEGILLIIGSGVVLNKTNFLTKSYLPIMVCDCC